VVATGGVTGGGAAGAGGIKATGTGGTTVPPGTGGTTGMTMGTNACNPAGPAVSLTGLVVGGVDYSTACADDPAPNIIKVIQTDGTGAVIASGSVNAGTYYGQDYVSNGTSSLSVMDKANGQNAAGFVFRTKGDAIPGTYTADGTCTAFAMNGAVVGVSEEEATGGQVQLRKLDLDPNSYVKDTELVWQITIKDGSTEAGCAKISQGSVPGGLTVATPIGIGR